MTPVTDLTFTITGTMIGGLALWIAGRLVEPLISEKIAQMKARREAFESVRWHSKWIEKHSTDCDELRRQNAELISELRESNQRLAVLLEAHHERMDKNDTEMGRVRDRMHELADRMAGARGANL